MNYLLLELLTIKLPGSLPCNNLVTSHLSRLISSHIGCVRINRSSKETDAGIEIRLDAADVSDLSLVRSASSKF